MNYLRSIPNRLFVFITCFRVETSADFCHTKEFFNNTNQRLLVPMRIFYWLFDLDCFGTGNSHLWQKESAILLHYYSSTINVLDEDKQSQQFHTDQAILYDRNPPIQKNKTLRSAVFSEQPVELKICRWPRFSQDENTSSL
jgi:hypothetical protein